MRQYASAFAGSLVLLCTVFETIRGSWGLYLEFYRIPKEKYGVLSPLRWQDGVFIIGFYGLALVLGYLSYRLLSYAFRQRGALCR